MTNHHMFSLADRMEAVYKAIKHYATKLLHSNEPDPHTTHPTRPH